MATAPGVTTNADSYWHNSAITVHLRGSDAASGIGQLGYRLQGGGRVDHRGGRRCRRRRSSSTPCERWRHRHPEWR
jgi:hypothetical protein